MEPAGGTTTLVLLTILVLGLIGPEIFRKLKLPYFSSLIILGAVLGENGLGVIGSDPVIAFFGFLGFTFLMFMAGLESDISSLKSTRWKVSVMALMNGLIPFLAGFGIVYAFGYGLLQALLVGIILMSSSVAIIFPAIRSTKLFKKSEGQIMITAVLFEDIFSLVMLAIVLQSVAPITPFPLPVYFAILFSSVILLKWLLPRVAQHILRSKLLKWEVEHEEQLRFVIVILIAVLVFFSAIGVHPILAAFLVGLLLADVLTSRVLREKIHTLGYGLFVPVFFFIAGTEMDLTIFSEFDTRNTLVILLILGAITSKFLSGYVGGRIARLSSKHATVFGIISTTQLTTTLAATFAAASLNILDTTLTTAIIGLSIITTIFAPIVAHIFTHSHKPD